MMYQSRLVRAEALKEITSYTIDRDWDNEEGEELFIKLTGSGFSITLDEEDVEHVYASLILAGNRNEFERQLQLKSSEITFPESLWKKFRVDFLNVCPN